MYYVIVFLTDRNVEK